MSCRYNLDYTMSLQPDIRAQLKSLSIQKDKRPAARASAPARSRRPGLAKTLVGTLLVALILFEAGAWYFTGSLVPARLFDAATSSSAAEVTLLTVSERRDTEPMPVHTATGKIVSDHKVRVTTKVSGQIVELLFEQGDRVRQGQVLARLESVLPRARRDEAAAALEKSKATLDYQRISFERVERLYKVNNAPEIEYADARRAYEESLAQVAQNEAALAWAEKILADCEVVAPISGVILERNVEIGDFVAAEGGLGANANAQFGTIVDMNALRVEVDISELDIARIKKDMRCIITPDAYKDRRYDGHVMWIDPGANYSKATVQVKVRIENPDPSLRVEGVAQVVFLAPQEENAQAGAEGASAAGRIWIPASACLPAADGKTARVFVAADGRLKETTIRIGRRIASQVEVVGSLSAGQVIAADKLESLADGRRIKQ